MVPDTDVLVEDLAFPEAPRWRGQSLYVSDMYGEAVLCVAPDTGTVRVVARVPGRPSGLGFLPDGRLLVVSMLDRRILACRDDGTDSYADLGDMVRWWANDMLVDARGRAYVGNFGFDYFGGAEPAATHLVMVSPDGPARVVADDLHGPNGTVVTPDGRTLVIAESMARHLTAFDVAHDGSLQGRRVWADLPEGVVPDGICLDAGGAIWVACPKTGRCYRIREGGEVLDVVTLRGSCGIAPALGGPGRRTLFVCSADTIVPEECVARRPGRIETVRVEVPGAGLP